MTRPPTEGLSPAFNVFTPQSWSAHNPERVFRSLAAQTFGDVAWLVGNDGSSDASEPLVRAWQSADFRAPYLLEEPRGKQVAMSGAVAAVLGEPPPRSVGRQLQSLCRREPPPTRMKSRPPSELVSRR